MQPDRLGHRMAFAATAAALAGACVLAVAGQPWPLLGVEAAVLVRLAWGDR